MASRVTVNNSGRIAEQVSKQLEQAIAKGAHDVEANAKVTAPIDTGFLRNSIIAGKVAPKHWRVSAFAAYAKFVEFGTMRQPAKPFLIPSLDKVRPSLMAAIKRIRTR